MTKFNAARRFLAFAALAFASSWAAADSWAPPRTQITASSNGQYRVTVVPRGIESPLAYFEGKTKGDAAAGQRKGDAQTSPIARVEKRGTKGSWAMVWQKPLVNDVAPPTVLLANDASFLVTFDNWHSAGYGDDVVVIYDRHGNLVRKLSLEQILPPAYVHQLPRSVSSRWWSGEHRLVDGDRLVELAIVEPGSDRRDEAKYVPVRIRLADGVVMTPSGAAWTRAMAKANALEAQRQAAWDALRERRSRPLSAPASTHSQDWRDYMFELRDRVAREDDSMGGMLLAATPADKKYEGADRISDWIASAGLEESAWLKQFIFASPTSDLLAAVLVKSLRARATGSMKGWRVVFVGTPDEGRRVGEAASRAGADFSFVDRTVPFPPGSALPATPPPLWMP